MPDEEGKTFMPVEVGDWDAAVEASEKILVPAHYKVVIKDWQHGQGPKAQYISWQLATLDCPDPDDNDTPLWHNTPIDGRGFRIFVKFMQALGQRVEGGAVTPEMCNSLVGLELTVETGVSVNPNTGEDRAEVKQVIAAVNGV